MTDGQQGRVVVLDYGIGNLGSAAKAIAHLGVPVTLASEPDHVTGAAGVVLPGVGAFGPCARALAASGLEEAARRALDAEVPFLGICVGFQLLYEGSEESPGIPGLGILPGRVRKLPAGVKHPQMQWNVLIRRPDTPSALLAGLATRPWMYFVHSFAPEVGPETVATCDYGGPLAAAAEHGALWGTQFHPEKSGRAGLRLLGNFVDRCTAGAAAGNLVPAR